jgi:hypothetical protein
MRKKMKTSNSTAKRGRRRKKLEDYSSKMMKMKRSISSTSSRDQIPTQQSSPATEHQCPEGGTETLSTPQP